MVKIISSSFLFGLVFLGCSFAWAGYPEQKSQIDEIVAIGGDCRGQIARICAFTLDKMREEKNPHYQRPLQKMGMGEAVIEGEGASSSESSVSQQVSWSYEEVVVLGGLAKLKELQALENPTGGQVIQAGLFASALLSPAIFPEDFKYPSDFGLYKRVVAARVVMVGAGGYIIDHAKFDQAHRQGVKYYDPANHPFHILSHYLKPLVLLGEDAVFDQRAFLYGLSKGVVLMALNDQFLPLHGGVYQKPVEVIVHDQAHVSDFLPINDTTPADRECGVKELSRLAGKFLEWIDHPSLFSSDEKPKALRAAYYLLHENRISPKWGYLTRPVFFENLNTYRVSKLVELFRDTTELYSQLAIQDGDSPYEAKFERKSFSDMAASICEIYPEAEDDIFGSNSEADRTCDYNPSKVVEWSMNLVTWFADKVKEQP